MEEEDRDSGGCPGHWGCEGEGGEWRRQRFHWTTHWAVQCWAAPSWALGCHSPLQVPATCAALAARRPACRCPGAHGPQHPKLQLLPTSPWSQVPSMGWGAGGLGGWGHRLRSEQAAEALGSLPGHSSPRGSQGRRVASGPGLGGPPGRGSAGLGQLLCQRAHLVTSRDPRPSDGRWPSPQAWAQSGPSWRDPSTRWRGLRAPGYTGASGCCQPLAWAPHTLSQ